MRTKITLRELEKTNPKEFKRVMDAIIKNRRNPSRITARNPNNKKRAFEQKLYITLENLLKK